MISRNPPNPRHANEHGAPSAQDDARRIPDFKPNKNAAKRAGVTPRDVARLEAVAKLEGKVTQDTAKLELATRIDVSDPNGSHRKQAAAKLSAGAHSPQPLPVGTARANAASAGAVAGPLASLERAVSAFAEQQAKALRKPTR